MDEANKKIVFWTCNNDDEYLTCDTENEAIFEYLENIGELSDAPGEIEVFGFSRREINVERFKTVIAGYAQEWLDEEYGGEDEVDLINEKEVSEACDKFVSIYVKNYTPWACEKVLSKKINTKLWIEKNEPQWLESLK